MIGNFSPALCKLDIPKRTFYRNAYCGVCQAIKKQYGRMAALNLTHDAIFLVFLAPFPNELSPQSYPCTANPLRTIKAFPVDHPAIVAGLLLNSVFVLCKYYDDLEDQDKISWPKKLAISSYLKNSEQFLEKIDLSLEEIKSILKKQSQAEKIPQKNWQLYLEPIAILGAKIFGKVFGKFSNDSLARLLGRLYIYSIAFYDGISDYRQDLQRGNFNILVPLTKQMEKEQACDYIWTQANDFLEIALNICPEENKDLLHNSFKKGFLAKLSRKLEHYLQEDQPKTS